VVGRHARRQPSRSARWPMAVSAGSRCQPIAGLGQRGPASVTLKILPQGFLDFPRPGPPSVGGGQPSYWIPSRRLGHDSGSVVPFVLSNHHSPGLALGRKNHPVRPETTRERPQAPRTRQPRKAIVAKAVRPKPIAKSCGVFRLLSGQRRSATTCPRPAPILYQGTHQHSGCVGPPRSPSETV